MDQDHRILFHMRKRLQPIMNASFPAFIPVDRSGKVKTRNCCVIPIAVRRVYDDR